MKQDLLNRVKQELYPVIDSITIENMEDQHKIIQTYFDFMKSLKSLPDIGIQIASTLQVEETLAPTLAPEKKEPVKEEDLAPTRYQFERKLRGGIILGLEGNYLIPEKLVRDMGVEHGDKVVVSNTVSIRGESRYRFEIIEKSNTGPAPSRNQIDQCIVEHNERGISYIIKNTVNGPIEASGEQFTFVINKKDIMDFNIKEGDIVDIAFYDNNIDGAKIIHKYDIHEIVPPAPVATRRTVAKKEEKDDKEIRQFPIDVDFMKNKKIVIVGSEYEKVKYQQAFGLVGMDLIHMSGDEGKTRLRTAIRKADVVVITTQYVGHKGSVPTGELCKEYDVPLAAIEKNGPQYILIEAEKVMKRKLEQQAVTA